jgi:phosphoribosyl-AMP cyclohydrolase
MTKQEMVILFQVKKGRGKALCSKGSSSGHFKSWENTDCVPDTDTIRMFVGQVLHTMTEQELVILFQVK